MARQIKFTNSNLFLIQIKPVSYGMLNIECVWEDA